MVKALKIAIDRENIKDDGDMSAITTWIESFDRLFAQQNVSPVVWETSETDDKVIFTAWIPPDCLPEFDEMSDFIAETFSKLDPDMKHDPEI